MSDDTGHAHFLAQLKRAVDASADVIFVTDARGVITFVNPQFTAIYGYTPDDVIGKATPRILKSGIHSRRHYDQFWHDLVNGTSVQVRMVNRAKDGRLVEIEGSANPILEEDRVTGFVAVQRDVTDQRALQHSHHLARFASDEAADGIFWVAHDGRIGYANEAAAQMLGYSREELRAMTVPQIAPTFTPERYAEHFSGHFPAGKARVETALRRKDGTEFPAEIAISYREIEDQRTSVAIVRDLTEHKRLEAELQQAQKMEVVGRLAGGIAHDFNNLLTAILGFSQFALDQARDSPDLLADISEIKSAGERAERLTRQLLSFSRRQLAEPRVLDLNELVSELRSMMSRMIGDDVQLDVVAGAPLASVRLDPGQVEQVLLNLIVNARDAMPKGGRLTIATSDVDLDAEFARRHPGAAQGPHVALSVTDTGTGIPPDVLGRVLEPFFTTKPQGKGTGLGLATVADIVQGSGGCLAIESTVGVGTVVTGYFPRVDAPLESEAPAVRAAYPDHGSETILLVEDDTAVRELALRVLKARGYVVLHARDGRAALNVETGHAGDIHLLLTDVLMPGLSGPDLAQRFVRRRPAMKVLYMSGFGRQMAVASRLIGRQTSFLQKPFTPDMLALNVRDLLDREADIVGQAFAAH